MTPQNLDLVLAGIVLLFVLNGFLQGIIHMLGAVLGLVVGVAVAARYDAAVGSWIAGATGWSQSICTILGFVLTLILFTRVFGVALHLLEKTFNFLKVPLVGLANRIAGGVLGFFEGIFVVGSTLMVINTLPFPALVKTVSESNLAGALIAASMLLLPLMPKGIRDLYSVPTVK